MRWGDRGRQRGWAWFVPNFRYGILKLGWKLLRNLCFSLLNVLCQFSNRKLLARPRKRPKKKGAAQTPRGLLFRELPLGWKRGSALRALGDSRGEGGGRKRAEKPLPPPHQTGGVGKPGAPARRCWGDLRGKAPSPGPEGGGGDTFSLAPGNSSGILKQLLTHFLTLFRMWVYFNTVPGLTACCTAHLE